MPEIANVVSGNTITSAWGNQIRDRTIQRYASVAARTAAHPSPTEGELSYLQDLNVVEYYNGSAWIPIAAAPAVMLGGASEAVFDSSLSASFENGATVTFVKPAGWATYEILAWGSVMFQEALSPGGGSARIQIGSDNGTTFAIQTGDNQPLDHECSIRHHRTGLSTDMAITAQYSGSSVAKQHSQVNYIATRLT